MTYRRSSDTWPAATTRSAAAIGEWRLAEHLGISTSRIRQCANPMRPDLFTLEQAALADIAAHNVGAGCPHFEEYKRRLTVVGALEATAVERLFLSLPVLLRAAVMTLLAALAPGATQTECAA